MPYIVADRVKETTTVTGTGPATLAGAASGYRSFASQLSIGDTCAYVIVNSNASEWETGIGTYSAVNTLTRTTIHASTNANAAVVFTAGVKDVFMGPTADSLVDYNPVTGAISNATWNGSTISTSKGGTGLTTLGTANQALAVNSAGTALEYHTVVGSVASADGSVTVSQTGQAVDLSVAVAAAATNVVVQVRNDTGATLTKGTVVYINNAIGQLPTVAKALATADNTSAQTLGMISADLANNSNGFVTIIGLITGINTQAYNDGDQLYLSNSVAGTFTNVKPLAPSHLVYVGIVEYKNPTNGKIFVKVQNGYELDELHNVEAVSPSNGQTIVYNSTSQLWEKNTVSLTAGVNGTLPVANGGTGVTTSTGTGSVVLSNTPTLVTPQTNAVNAVPVVSGAGNNLTFTAGSGVGTGAGGSLYFHPGVQATSGGNGVMVVTNPDASGTSNSPIFAVRFADTNLSYQIAFTVCYPGKTGLWLTNANALYAGCTGVNNSDGGAMVSSSQISIRGDNGKIGFPASTDPAGTLDAYFTRDAAGVLAQRNGTNAQTFRVYNTYTDASNYERFSIGWSSNLCTLGYEKAGTGAQRYVSLDLGANPSAGANKIVSVGTNAYQFWSSNTVWMYVTNGLFGYAPYYYAGAIRGIQYGNNNAGAANRIGDSYVFRITGGSGTSDPGYIGFGAAYSPVGATSTTGHTQQDALLIKLLASATPIVAFGDSFVSTVPAIKRVGTKLQARLADDSGYATWEGPLNSNAVSAIALPTAATVTAATGDGTTVTYTAANTFSVGQVVSITGLTITTGSSLNLSNQTITTASATQFTVTNATVGTAAATQSGTATIQSAGNSVTITAGNGSGVGAGGNIILQPGAQGTSGGNGQIRINTSAGVDTGFNFTNTYASYPTLEQARLYIRSGSNSNVIELNALSGNIAIGKTNGQFTIGSSDNANYVGIRDNGNAGTLGVICGSNSAGGSLNFISSTTAIAANTNDLALSASAFQRISCTTNPYNLTGIAPVTGTGSAHKDGRMIRIYNVGTPNLTLVHNSALSIAANRMFSSTGADIILAPNDYAELIYDATSNGSGAAGWRVS